MRIGLINITKLTRVRDTFKPGWRTIVAINFLLSVFLWLAALHQLKSLSQIVDDATIRMRTLILAAVVLPPLAAALFRKNDLARLFFAVVTAFNLATLTLVILISIYAASSMSDREQAVAFLLLMWPFFLWVYQLVPCYVLFLSVMPFGRWKAYRQQVNYSRRLWSGQWKGLDEPQGAGAREKPYLTPGARYRLALGWAAFAVGIVTSLFSLFSLVNFEFLPAIFRLELSMAWDMLTNFQLNDGDPSDTYWTLALDATRSIGTLFLGFFWFFVFGYFWTQWQRENVLVYRRTPLLQHMTPWDLLLLRSFRDDVKYVSRKNSVWTLMFRVYGWSFTFEQLIVNRLKYLGRVRLIDVKQQRKELLSKWGVRFIAGMVGRNRLRKLLISIFPAVWYKLPARGGVRYYIKGKRDEERWRVEIEKAMSLARVVIVLLGTTDSLTWEMRRLEQLRLSEKTLFVMPPLIRKKNYRERWRKFTDLMCEAHGCDKRLMGKVNPKRVLAVTVRENLLVIITGKRSSQRFYESALDVASILTVADSAQSGKLIPKYLK